METKVVRNSIEPNTTPLWVSLLCIISTVVVWTSPASALPAPTSQQVITPYTAIATPVVNAAAEASRPIAFGAAALGNGDFTLQVRTDTLDAPMNAYLVIVAPRLLPGALLLFNASGGLELFTGTLIPWKTNITSLNESPFGSIPLTALPADDYGVFLLLAQAGSNNPLGNTFYLWGSTLPLGSASDADGVNHLTLFSNPSDSALLAFTTDSGEQLTLMGRKDEGGSAGAVTQIDLIDDAGGQYVIEFDAFGLLTRVIDKAGNFISFDFMSDQETPANSQSPQMAPAAATSVSSIVAELGTADDGVVVKTLFDLYDQRIQWIIEPNQDLAAFNARYPVGNLTIDVLQCGEPATPSKLDVVVTRPNSAFIDRYPTYKTSTPGRFVANLPQQNDYAKDLANVCASVESALDLVCKVNGTTSQNLALQPVLCAQLAAAAAAASATVAGIAAIPVFPLCLAAFNAANVACGTLGASVLDIPDPDNPSPLASSVLKNICNNVETSYRAVDRLAGTDRLIFQAVASFNGGIPSFSAPGSNVGVATSDVVTVPVTGPFPHLTIAHDEDCPVGLGCAENAANPDVCLPAAKVSAVVTFGYVTLHATIQSTGSVTQSTWTQGFGSDFSGQILRLGAGGENTFSFIPADKDLGGSQLSLVFNDDATAITSLTLTSNASFTSGQTRHLKVAGMSQTTPVELLSSVPGYHVYQLTGDAVCQFVKNFDYRFISEFVAGSSGTDVSTTEAVATTCAQDISNARTPSIRVTVDTRP